MNIKQTNKAKHLRSSNYNYYFNKKTGLFVRWGQTKEDDPDWAQMGPEILDLEISTSVDDTSLYPRERLVYDGGCKGKCPFCYKGNGAYPTYNMTFDEFKNIFDKMGQQLTQIAFGIMNIDTNPDFFRMAEYARSQGVIPNFTMHPYEYITSEKARRIYDTFGAVAISYYDKERTLQNAANLYKAGMRQINLHYMLSSETLQGSHELFDEWKKDERFQFIHAIVFLSLKRKGRGTQYSPVEFKDYKVLVERALKENIPVGFDSCSAHKFLSSVKDSPHYIQYEMASEPCESGCFSSYVNAKGEFYPCSFVEGVGDWTEGISVLNSNSFLDIWNDQRVVLWRENLLKHRRHCPVFSI